MLIILWGLVDSPLLGVVFILILLALSTVRYRITPYRFLPALEAAICVVCAAFWLPALAGLWLPVIGLLEIQWKILENGFMSRMFEERTERLKLENVIGTSSQDTKNAAQLAKLNERARIAQDIHDHVGHEISGASIALQTAIKLYQREDERTGELLKQCALRLESASAHLRETVHNLKPAQTTNVESLRTLCDSFDYCTVNFVVTGDMDNVAYWELLMSNLKETLTNVSRHSNADFVNVRLDGNAGYIRMIVMDNGKTANETNTLKASGKGAAPFKPGLGLSGMKDRIHAAGGTFTINAMTDGFQVICVLPKVKGE